MHSPVLTVSIITPQSWLQQKATKRRRKPRLSHGSVTNIKRVRLAKEELLNKVIESRVQIKKSPTNGLTLDPFQTFPIPATGCVAQMAQYFVQTWAPQHGPAFGFEGHSNPYLSLLWPHALQCDVYFEGLVALSRATSLASAGRSPRIDSHFVCHRGNVMTRLRARLEDPEQCSDDTTILLVATLGTIDYILGDHSAACAHVSGMRQIIKLRGGIQATTPWEKLLTINVAAYEALWSFLFVADSSPDDKPRPESQILQNAELPIYMAHPFKPEVCEMLAKLPQGLCEVGLTGVLSLQMIRLLCDFVELKAKLLDPSHVKRLDDITRRKIQIILEDLHRLATLQTTPTEKFLSYGMVAYSYLLKDICFEDHLTGFHETALRALADMALGQKPGLETPKRRCFLWSNVMIGTVLQHARIRPPGWTAVMRQCLDTYNEARQWSKLEKQLNLFFFEDDIRFFAKEAYDEAVRRREAGGVEEKDSRPATMAIRNVII